MQKKKRAADSFDLHKSTSVFRLRRNYHRRVDILVARDRPSLARFIQNDTASSFPFAFLRLERSFVTFLSSVNERR